MGMPGEGKVLVGDIGQAGIALQWDTFWFDVFNRNSNPPLRVVAHASSATLAK